MKEETVYTAKNVVWVLAYKIIDLNGIRRLVRNLTYFKIEGMIPSIKFNVTYDNNTGNPIINLIDNEFNMNHSKVPNR